MSDLSDRLRQYADIAEAGGKQHWAEAMREAMYTLAVYRDNSVKEQRENAALRHDIERHVKIASDLATELEGVRKDAERLDWMEDVSKCYWVQVDAQPDGHTVRAGQGTGLRAAIDAAIAAGKEKP